MTSSGTAFEVPEPLSDIPRERAATAASAVSREASWGQSAVQTQREREGHAQPDGDAPRELKLWWGKDFQGS